MYYLIAIALFIGVLVGYFGGVRKGQAWGSPLVVLCLLGVIAVIGFQLFGGGTRRPAPSTRQLSASQDEQNAELAGQALAPLLAGPSSICLITSNAGADFEARKQNWQTGLKKALGDSVNQVDAALAAPMKNAADDPVITGADAIVAIDGPGAVLFAADAIQGKPLVIVFPKNASTEDRVQDAADNGQMDAGIIDGKIITAGGAAAQ